MIIDDDKDLPVLVKAILVQNGYRASIFHDAESAIKDVKKKKPDLILMDFMLPGMNGAEAIKEIRKDSVNKDIAVIFLTGLVSTKDSDLKESGINVDGLKYQTLGKPFDIKELLALVKGMLV
jgi:two-component system alkaline phosphatase synthesis response regulator PhoP